MTRLVLVAASTPARGLTIGVFLAVLRGDARYHLLGRARDPLGD
jgi:hypothetical protein